MDRGPGTGWDSLSPVRRRTGATSCLWSSTERLPGSGHLLHTAVPVPVNGLLTYVPQSFFDEEKAAWDLLERTAED